MCYVTVYPDDFGIAYVLLRDELLERSSTRPLRGLTRRTAAQELAQDRGILGLLAFAAERGRKAAR